MGKHKEKERRKKKKTTTPLEEEQELAHKYREIEDGNQSKAEEEPKLDVKIQTLGENPDKLSPVLGYFPSGYDPLEHQRKGGESEAEVKVKLYRNVKMTKRMELVVSPVGSSVDFVGTNYSGEATAPQLCTYGLGVLDKSTQTLRIVPVAGNKVQVMAFFCFIFNLSFVCNFGERI